MTKHIKALVADITCHKMQTSVVDSAVKAAWYSHKDNLLIARDKNNPLRGEALDQLRYGIELSTEALNTDLLKPLTRPMALMFSRINLDSAMAFAGHVERLQKAVAGMTHR